MINKQRLKAMERQCKYRMGDGCPCDDFIDCRIPDGLLLAEQAVRVHCFKARLENLRKRFAEQQESKSENK